MEEEIVFDHGVRRPSTPTTKTVENLVEDVFETGKSHDKKDETEERKLLDNYINAVDELYNDIFPNETSSINEQRRYEIAREMHISPKLWRDMAKLAAGGSPLSQRRARDLFRFLVMYSADGICPTDRLKEKRARSWFWRLFGCGKPQRKRTELEKALYNTAFDIRVIVEHAFQNGAYGACYVVDVVRIFIQNRVNLNLLLTLPNKTEEKLLKKDLKFLQKAPKESAELAESSRTICVWRLFETLDFHAKDFDHTTNFDTFVYLFDLVEAIFFQNSSVTGEFLRRQYLCFASRIQKLLLSPNFYILARTLNLLFKILTHDNFRYPRQQWISRKENLEHIVRLMQHKMKMVRYHAINIFEEFLFLPELEPGHFRPVDMFMIRNKEKLTKYFFENAPLKSDHEEKEDFQFARILNKIIYLKEGPHTEEELEEIKEGAKLFKKITKEREIEKRRKRPEHQRIQKVYNMEVPSKPPHLRAPVIFGSREHTLFRRAAFRYWQQEHQPDLWEKKRLTTQKMNDKKDAMDEEVMRRRREEDQQMAEVEDQEAPEEDQEAPEKDDQQMPEVEDQEAPEEDQKEDQEATEKDQQKPEVEDQEAPEEDQEAQEEDQEAPEEDQEASEEEDLTGKTLADELEEIKVEEEEQNRRTSEEKEESK